MHVPSSRTITAYQLPLEVWTRNRGAAPPPPATCPDAKLRKRRLARQNFTGAFADATDYVRTAVCAGFLPKAYIYGYSRFCAP
jgi:hypothetical protein